MRIDTREFSIEDHPGSVVPSMGERHGDVVRYGNTVANEKREEIFLTPGFVCVFDEAQTFLHLSGMLKVGVGGVGRCWGNLCRAVW